MPDNEGGDSGDLSQGAQTKYGFVQKPCIEGCEFQSATQTLWTEYSYKIQEDEVFIQPQMCVSRCNNWSRVCWNVYIPLQILTEVGYLHNYELYFITPFHYHVSFGGYVPRQSVHKIFSCHEITYFKAV
jgi:hypothetical protein